MLRVKSNLLGPIVDDTMLLILSSTIASCFTFFCPDLLLKPSNSSMNLDSTLIDLETRLVESSYVTSMPRYYSL